MNADELKKADEIVKALRDYASDCDDDESCCQCTFAWVCDKCGNNAPKIIADLIDDLTAQLTASRRREKAAVEEIRNYPGITPCHACKHWLGPNKGPSKHCRIVDRACFDWRGPQKAEKGEAE